MKFLPTGSQKRALVIRGPSDVRSKEVVFMQFSSNETGEDFSAIGYMIFADFSDFMVRLVLRMADNCFKTVV